MSHEVADEKVLRLFQDGRCAMEAGRYADALGLLTESNTLDSHYKTLELIAECMTALGRDDEGYAFAEAAYEMNPRNDKTGVLFAEALTTRGDLDRARRVLIQILKRNPSSGPARRRLEEIG